jgi:hypothetical protein
MCAINVFVIFIIISGHLLNADVGYNIVYCDVNLDDEPNKYIPEGYSRFWRQYESLGAPFLTFHLAIVIM